MLRTDGPNALSSAAYAEDFNEIKELGSLTSTTRTADETAAAIVWQDSGSAPMRVTPRTTVPRWPWPPGHVLSVPARGDPSGLLTTQLPSSTWLGPARP